MFDGDHFKSVVEFAVNEQNLVLRHHAHAIVGNCSMFRAYRDVIRPILPSMFTHEVTTTKMLTRCILRNVGHNPTEDMINDASTCEHW